MKNIIVLLSIVLLSACITEKKVTEYVDNNVPVAVVPEPPKVERPELEIDKMTDSEIYADLPLSVKNLLISLKQENNYSSILEAVIEQYRLLALKNPDLEELNAEVLRKAIENQPRSTSLPLANSDENFDESRLSDLEKTALRFKIIEMMAEKQKENEYKEVEEDN